MQWDLLALHQRVLHCTWREEPRDRGRLATCTVAEELCDSRSLWRPMREVMYHCCRAEQLHWLKATLEVRTLEACLG